MLLTRIQSIAAFSPPDLNLRPLPSNFDASTAKPANMSWWEWCDPPGRDDMDVPLSNRSLKLMRDTPWLQLRAATLDILAALPGEGAKGAFSSPVADFYLTNPIARASRVLAECSSLARGRALEAAE